MDRGVGLQGFVESGSKGLWVKKYAPLGSRNLNVVVNACQPCFIEAYGCITVCFPLIPLLQLVFVKRPTAIMAGMAPEGSQFDAKQFDSKMADV